MEDIKRHQKEYLILLFVLALSIVLRLPAFAIPHIENDEIIYLTLAEKVSKNFLDYSLEGTGIIHQLPKSYYGEKIFKHPPLFVWTIAIVQGLGLKGSEVAVSIFFSIATILLVYLIAKELYPPPTPLIAACVAAYSPLLFFVSTKVWIDSMLTALMTLSAFLFLAASRKQAFILYILSGISLGAALLTKYLAIALLPALLYIFIRKNLNLRFRYFALYLTTFLAFTAVVIGPWIYFYSMNSGFSSLWRQVGTAEYAAMFPFVKSTMERPWHSFFTYIFPIAPIYLFAYYGAFRRILKKQGLFEAIWIFSVLLMYTYLAFNKKIGYTMRYLVIASPAFAILAAHEVNRVVKINKAALPAVFLLLLFGLASGIISSYLVIGAGDVFSAYKLFF